MFPTQHLDRLSPPIAWGLRAVTLLTKSSYQPHRVTQAEQEAPSLRPQLIRPCKENHEGCFHTSSWASGPII